MGQYRHPWDFGITPSQYIRSMKEPGQYIEEAVTALGRGRYDEGVERLDALFRQTLKCPTLRIMTPEQRKAIESFGTKDAVLTATYARPGCYFYSLDKRKAKEFFSKMDKLGLGKLHLADLDVPSGDPIDDKMGALNMSFSEDVNNECVYAHRESGKSIPVSAYHLVTGIAFGFPVGDVVEVSRGSQYMLFEPSVVSHFVARDSWSDLWKEKVGMKGEERLAEIYKRVLEMCAEK